VLRLAPTLAAALLVTLVASAVTPCRDDIGTAAQPTAAANVHAHAGDEAEVTPGQDAGCHGARLVPDLRAVCDCGCSDRPTAAGVPTGFGWALLPSAPAIASPEGLTTAPRFECMLRETTPNPIDHVPLAA
jgi:hypothetical protein